MTDKSMVELRNEHNRRKELVKMQEAARSAGIPDEGWYISSRREKDGTVTYHGDWTALGLIWLLNMDDRMLKSIRSRVIKSSLDNKGVAIATCTIEFFTGAVFEREGRASLGEAPDKGYGYCDDVAETRAMKRAAVLATGKGLIDHPTGRDEDGREGETGDS